MGFKTVEDYNEERFGGLFLLRNDKDYADVIFLYQSVKDVLVADVHYIKSADYSGYVHCCGNGCPACARKIRTQTKLFIPVYNIRDKEIQFFDRSMRFEPQLQADVFSRYPNPSEFVFRITRNGDAGDINTTYEIVAVGKNNLKSYSQILAENGAKMPDYYEHVCRDLSVPELEKLLNQGDAPTGNYMSSDGTGYASYGAVPRGQSNYESMPVPEDIQTPEVPMPVYGDQPVYGDTTFVTDSGKDSTSVDGAATVAAVENEGAEGAEGLPWELSEEPNF